MKKLLEKIRIWYKADSVSYPWIHKRRRYITIIRNGKRLLRAFARAKFCTIKRVHLSKRVVVDHEDGNSLNDKISNLRPLTFGQNNKEAYRHGKKPVRNTGEKNGNAILTEAQVFELKKMYATSEYTLKECIDKLALPIKLTTAKSILQGKRWANVKVETKRKKLIHSGRPLSIKRDVLLKAYKLHNTGISVANVATQLNISKDVLYREFRKLGAC